MKKIFVTAMYVLLYTSAFLFPVLITLGDFNYIGAGLLFRIYVFLSSTEILWRYFYSIAVTVATFHLVKNGAVFSQVAGIMTILIIGFFLVTGTGNIFDLAYLGFIAGLTNKLWKLFDKQEKINIRLQKEVATLSYSNKKLNDKFDSMNNRQSVM